MEEIIQRWSFFLPHLELNLRAKFKMSTSNTSSHISILFLFISRNLRALVCG